MTLRLRNACDARLFVSLISLPAQLTLLPTLSARQDVCIQIRNKESTGLQPQVRNRRPNRQLQTSTVDSCGSLHAYIMHVHAQYTRCARAHTHARTHIPQTHKHAGGINEVLCRMNTAVLLAVLLTFKGHLRLRKSFWSSKMARLRRSFPTIR